MSIHHVTLGVRARAKLGRDPDDLVDHFDQFDRVVRHGIVKPVLQRVITCLKTYNLLLSFFRFSLLICNLMLEMEALRRTV